MSALMMAEKSMNVLALSSLPCRRLKPKPFDRGAGQGVQDRRDDRGNEGVHDRRERGADDDGNRQIDDVAAHDEVLETLDHR